MSFTAGSIPVLQKSTYPVNAPFTNYTSLNPSTTIFSKGYKKHHENRSFETSTIFDKDIPIHLRDGIIIRADVFRPETELKVPALLAWSPFGKSGTGLFSLDDVPNGSGVEKSILSGYQSFGGPDPAEWTARGYAVVNVDPRGVFDSEGDLRWLGKAEGRDGYDTIEEIAKLPWCNGNIGMTGSSWLAMAQWFIAAERPPHLKCIAPFGGASDFYREGLFRAGVPNMSFWESLSGDLCGRRQQEDVIAMLQRYPSMNEYWEDKRAKTEDIDVPVYVSASYSDGIHTVGNFRGYENIKHGKKWLRVHAMQEGEDLYRKETISELQLFFDSYLKAVNNGWESTPKVRMSVYPSARLITTPNSKL